MTFSLRYSPPPEEPAGDDVYALAGAGATAAVELDGYVLPVDGTGLAELQRQAERLLALLEGGEPALGDDDLRAELPGIPAGAVLHSWIFASYMAQLPVIMFAINGAVTTVYTRTRDEAPEWPMIVLEGRDRADPVEVPTDELRDGLRRFLGKLGG